MDEKILNLLTEMNKELKSMKLDIQEFKTDIQEFKTDMQEFKTDMQEFKTEMHHRFDKVEAKLEGVGGQFELTNESRIDEFDFINDKVNKLEKEIYFLRSKNN